MLSFRGSAAERTDPRLRLVKARATIIHAQGLPGGKFASGYLLFLTFGRPHSMLMHAICFSLS